MRHQIAVIPGDGIGKEVVPEGMSVLEAAGRRFGFEFEWEAFDWSCEVYTRTGRMMPEDGLEQLGRFEAIYLGAVGFRRSDLHSKLLAHVGRHLLASHLLVVVRDRPTLGPSRWVTRFPRLPGRLQVALVAARVLIRHGAPPSSR